jgi:DNA-binding NtrC family response regulator
VVPIRAPALRERLSDVPLLVEHFVRRFAAESDLPPPAVTPEAMEHLMSRPWPGNVRELANAVERAVILHHDGLLSVEAFQVAGGIGKRVEPGPAGAGSGPTVVPSWEAEVLDLRLLEGRAIARALEVTHGHRARAARLLGISERTLRNRLNPREGGVP